MSNNVHPSLTREPSARKVRADAIAIIVMGVLAAAGAITLAVRTFRSVFTPNGIVWKVPVQPLEATADGLRLYGPDGPEPVVAVDGLTTELTVIVPGLNTVSNVLLAVAIVVAATAALAVIASTARLAWLFTQDRFFTVQTSRALRTLSYTGAIGGAIAFACWGMGSNGVSAALGVRATDTPASTWWSWYAIVLFTVTAFGLADIALRRGIRLQQETEGLV